MKSHYSTYPGLALLLLFLGLLAFSCKKNNSTHPPAGPLQITAVSPLEGPAGTTVVIRGAGFSATPGANSVDFNGKAATVTYADDSILLVTVPLTAGTGNVSVKVNGTTAAGPSFTYDYQGLVTTYAGSSSALPGAVNGSRTSATFNVPKNIAVDGSGNLYVTDYSNKMVRKITSDGTVSTLVNLADNPWGVALDGKGNLYVSLFVNTPSILKVSLSTGDTSTLSGNGAPGFNNSPVGAMAQFYEPAGLAVDKNGNVYVADFGSGNIRAVTPSGATTTFVGYGAQNAAASTAYFQFTSGIVFDTGGNCYVTEGGNYNQIWRITPDTIISILAGDNNFGHLDGTGAAAGFLGPDALTIDSKGNLYVVESQNNDIRMITPAGVVTTIAGSGNSGSADGVGPAASFMYPSGIACDANGTLWVADLGNNTIRKITLQ